LLKFFEVRDKPNFDKIFKSYIGYHNLKRLRTSLDYLESLQKTLFTMIWQIGPPTFFIVFTSAKRLQDPFIKALHAQQSYNMCKIFWS